MTLMTRGRLSLAVVAATVVLALTAVACASTTTDPEAAVDQEDKGPSLFDRKEELEGDRERNLGEHADVHELRATVIGGEFRQELAATERAGYLVARVKLENAESDETSYDRLDWVLQLPDGTEVNRTRAAGVEDQIGSGDLTEGGVVEGSIAFQVGATRGDFFVVYAPRRHATDADIDKLRGVWKIPLA